ncbi:MAG: HAMP domain-containing sensor histidine kinase [Verrucomicrobia bacterium]|nr:HAMP domain-containing sensor histidine kinase [Verrucomicrobiota bacterium]
MVEIIGYLNRRSKFFLVITGSLLALLVCVIDLLTKDYYVLDCYLLPVFFVTWFAGRNAGFLMALISAVSEIGIDAFETPYHASPLMHSCTFFINCSFFLLVVYFLILLKESMEAKAKFTSTISHELRTPIAVIQEGINIVREGLIGDINDRQKELLGMVGMNAHRLTRLINDLLDFQKLESGKMKLVFEKTDINKVVQEAYAGVELLGRDKDLNAVFNLGEDLPVIRIDKDRIIQVLTNLLGNAIKFTERGGITIRTTKTETNIQVAVQDTGCGITPEDMARLFRRFEQLEMPGKSIKKGTGLGLAISKEIILGHGGKIWADSEIGRGSTFYFSLPVRN